MEGAEQIGEPSVGTSANPGTGLDPHGGGVLEAIAGSGHQAPQAVVLTGAFDREPADGEVGVGPEPEVAA